jgi:hypothetical protein
MNNRIKDIDTMRTKNTKAAVNRRLENKKLLLKLM